MTVAALAHGDVALQRAGLQQVPDLLSTTHGCRVRAMSGLRSVLVEGFPGGPGPTGNCLRASGDGGGGAGCGGGAAEAGAGGGGARGGVLLVID